MRATANGCLNKSVYKCLCIFLGQHLSHATHAALRSKQMCKHLANGMAASQRRNAAGSRIENSLKLQQKGYWTKPVAHSSLAGGASWITISISTSFLSLSLPLSASLSMFHSVYICLCAALALPAASSCFLSFAWLAFLFATRLASRTLNAYGNPYDDCISLGAWKRGRSSSHIPNSVVDDDDESRNFAFIWLAQRVFSFVSFSRFQLAKVFLCLRFFLASSLADPAAGAAVPASCQSVSLLAFEELFLNVTYA